MSNPYKLIAQELLENELENLKSKEELTLEEKERIECIENELILLEYFQHTRVDDIIDEIKNFPMIRDKYRLFLINYNDYHMYLNERKKRKVIVKEEIKEAND